MRKKIIGNSVTTPYPRPDWNQTDPTKADYIKNKPNMSASGSIVVDEVLDANSENPLQNKHIAHHISELMRADSDLTHRIDNEIGNIETALDNIIAIQNALIGGDSE